jgi:CBS domain-containing protein/ribosome-associated translation inhibitor RaiA
MDDCKMESGKVKEIYKKNFSKIEQDETLSKSLSLIKNNNINALIVIDNKDNYKGIISRDRLLITKLDPSKTKIKKLVLPAPKIEVHTSLSEAARLMIESEVRVLPVFGGEKLFGIIADEDIIHQAVLDNWGDVDAENIMTHKLFTLNQNESVGTALDLMRDKGIKHIPLIDDSNILVGIISSNDIVEYIYRPKNRQTLGERAGEKGSVLNNPLKGIMITSLITSSPNDSIREISDKMHKFDVESIILEKKGRPIGIITKRDFLEPISQMERKNLRLTVQFSIQNFTINETQRKHIMKDFNSFAEKFAKKLEIGTLFAYIKPQGVSGPGSKRTRLFHCRLKLRARKATFYSSAEGLEIEQAFQIALNKLDKQILRSRVFEKEQKFAREYLERVGIKPP